MQKRIFGLLLITAVAITATLSLFLIQAPIQAAPAEVDAQAAIVPESIDETEYFSAFLSGDQEVPAVSTDASGVARFTLVNTTTLSFEVAVSDIISITAAHIHMGAAGINGPAVFPLYTGTGDFDPDNPIGGTLMLTEDQADELRAGDYYINVHTAENPAGEIRGQIESPIPRTFSHALLTGEQNVPPIDTTAVGVGRLELSSDLATLSYTLAVDEIADIIAAHIHKGQPGEDGGVAYTLYGGGGTFEPGSPISDVLTIDVESVLDLINGNTYINVHTADYPSGEIRGQILGASPFAATLTGDQEVPPVNSDASGKAILAVNEDATKLHYRVMVKDITGITASHIHKAPVGENGPVVFTLFSGSGDFDEGNPIGGELDLMDDDIFDLLSGNYYINVHTADHPAGEIRGQITPHMPAAHYAALLAGEQEVPPVKTDASGEGIFTLDSLRGTLHYYVVVNNIENIVASHIHLGPVGQNGPVAFGLYSGAGMFDPAHPIGSGVTLNAENLVDLLTGFYYVNVHTEGYPAGEIRGQIGLRIQHNIYLPVVIGD